MNFGYKENGEKIVNPKHQYHVSQWEEHDCGTYNKKNGDYYEHASLSYFPDEH